MFIYIIRLEGEKKRDKANDNKGKLKSNQYRKRGNF